jgi:hypothetical protein
MSRVFRRPMFRKGGNVGEGIMTGIVDRENHEASDPGGVGASSTRERLLSRFDEYPDKSIDPLSQFLISGGLNLLSATPRGGTLATAAEAFKQPTGQLFKDIGAKERERRKIAMEGELIDIEGDIKKDVAKIQQRGALDIKKDYLDNVYDIKRKEAAGNQELLKQIEEDYQNDLNLYIVKGFDVSDIYNVIKGDEVQETILSQAEYFLKTNEIQVKGDDGKFIRKLITKDDPQYSAALLSTMANFTKKYAEQLKEGFATGGRVGFAMGTPQNMNQIMNQDAPKPPVTVGEKTVTSGPQMDITYEELRTRLPEQISNEVVKLLSTSYEALADFAELRTQADVDAFNSRYGVNLILPQEA